ncbi:MAG: hypothetical protein II712_03960 [Erysipelotrichaceae bacterium]|nr:hypothetical protein [Erysipelotrichaceae bacterium]MBQ4253963.1 hypothetical protein [Erysipelotrichaceae bacterium]
MADYQILVSVQIESDEIRLLAGEFFSDRLNVLGKKEIACPGLNGVHITDKNLVAGMLRRAVDELSVEIGAPIEGVLLCIPSYRFDITQMNPYQLVQSADQQISLEEIKALYREGNAYFVGNDREVINTVANTFKADFIVFKKMPLGRKSDYVEAEMQLLCCDKELTYDYLEVINKAKLRTIDIFVDCYALAKEAAFFEQTDRDNYILNIQLEKNTTVFSLINDGRLVNSASIPQGYNPILKSIIDKYGITSDKAASLLFRYVKCDETDYQSQRIITKYVDKNNEEHEITYGLLNQTARPQIDKVVSDIVVCCSSILAMDNVKVVITSAGASINCLDKVLSEKINREAISYYPETIGARESKWAVDLGMMYAYRDIDAVYQRNANSVNLDSYHNRVVESINIVQPEEGVAEVIMKAVTGKFFRHNESQED